MTKKRFDLDFNGIWDFQSDSDEYLESHKEICEQLNALHEENEQLKKEIKDLVNVNALKDEYIKNAIKR